MRAAALVTVLVLVPPPALAAGSPVTAARDLLALLSVGQRQAIALTFDSDDRFDWTYVPRDRPGLSLGRMGEAERAAAWRLVAASLSARGAEKVRDVLRLEEVLYARSGSRFRDPGRYFFTLFGTPVARGAWAWRYEGHHASLHWTIVDGEIVASAPQFLGANPAEVRDGPHRGLRALAAEEDLARELVRSLDAGQRAAAVLSSRAPSDILTRSSTRAELDDRRGIGWNDLSASQRDLLRRLVREYASVQSDAVAAGRLQRFESELDELRFAWMGGLEPGEGHYYRVRGASFLIEYDNTQDAANHVHSVWRDFDGEWGPDRLAEHYRTSPHHRVAAAGR